MRCGGVGDGEVEGERDRWRKGKKLISESRKRECLWVEAARGIEDINNGWVYGSVWYAVYVL